MKLATGASIASLCAAFSSDLAFAAGPHFSPGAAGGGDPYYPLDGNGGYDVEHYRLALRYEPATDRLSGRATISARATQDLSRFNLDLVGLDVNAIEVDGGSATWTREGGELTVTPRHGLRENARFSVAIDYGGVPQTLNDLGISGFIHTSEGALVAGEPHVASNWFPVNDHPSDRATYTFEISVPEGLDVVANGALASHRSRNGWETWVWDAKAPMASYLASLAIGHLDVSAYERDGIRYWDAIDSVLVAPIPPVPPTTGLRLLGSQQADSSYKRLTRVLDIPIEGATLSFSVTRRTELSWDYFFVEAHGVGSNDWTTLPDQGGFATQDTGSSCPMWHAVHPFLAHYQTPADPELGVCTPSGSSGNWWAATGESAGPEHWVVDLSAWAGTQLEVALAYASDDVIQSEGVFIDDIVVSTGVGSTSFEDDADELDGWTVAGPPEGSPGNANDWHVQTATDPGPPRGENLLASLAREPEILEFLSDQFGPYPFDVAGGIVTSTPIGFALESQTRPIYAAGFFADTVVVHELAHQWFGDSVSLAAWQHVWLNEGFATYAEWLWAEREGVITAQQQFDLAYQIDATDPFWKLSIGDPGPDRLFDFAVYYRGAMTLHQLRLAVGDELFFQILECWTSSYAGENVTTDDFIDLAEAIAGRKLGELFEAWLFVPAKPAAPSGTDEQALASRGEARASLSLFSPPLGENPVRAARLLASRHRK